MIAYSIGFFCSLILTGITFTNVRRIFHESTLQRPRRALYALLIIHLFSDCSWIFYIFLKESICPETSFYTIMFRIIWSIATIEHTSLLIPFYTFVYEPKRLKHFYLLLGIIATLCEIILVNINLLISSPLSLYCVQLCKIILIMAAMTRSLCTSLAGFTRQYSIIFKQQSQLAVRWFSISTTLTFVQILSAFKIFPFYFIPEPIYALGASYSLLFAVFITAKKLKQLRFLNCTDKVETGERIRSTALLHCAADVSEKIQHENEFIELTKRFFADGFLIDESRVSLHINAEPISFHSRQITPELAELVQFARKESWIFSHDELFITSTLISQSSPILEKTLALMNSLNALFLIPIIRNDVLLGEILITRDPKHIRLYSREAQNSMVMFARTIASALSLLNTNRALVALNSNTQTASIALQACQQAQQAQQHSALRVLDFGRSMQTVLDSQKMITAFLSYSRDSATAINREAIMLFGKTPTFDACRVTKTMAQTAHNVISYQYPITTCITRDDGALFEIEAVPHIGKTALLTVRCIPAQDSSARALIHEFACLEYENLKGTVPLIPLLEQVIEGSEKALISLKASLLQSLLRNEPIILRGTEAQLNLLIPRLIKFLFPAKETVIIDGAEWCTKKETFIHAKIFGFSQNQNVEEKSLLEQGQARGIILIKNVDLFPRAIQESFAQLSTFGTYTPLYGEVQKNTTPLIITTHDDPILKHASGALQPALFALISRLIITIPAAYQGRNESMQNAIPFTADGKLERFDPFLAHVRRSGKRVLSDHAVLSALWKRYENHGKIGEVIGVHRTTVYRACIKLNIIAHKEIPQISAHAHNNQIGTP